MVSASAACSSTIATSSAAVSPTTRRGTTSRPQRRLRGPTGPVIHPSGPLADCSAVTGTWRDREVQSFS